jgi:hypothetical protein
VTADEVEALASRFQSRTLPKAEWTHQAHLIVGAWQVHRFGLPEAINRLRDGIRRLNESHGTVNSATSGYHETVTVAYARVLAAFLAECQQTESFADCVNRLLAGPLADKNLLLRFYSRELLFSQRARAEWVEPDIGPIEVTDL